MKTYIKNDLASQSRVWVYQSTRQFTDTEAIVIAEKIQLFVNQWTAHKQGVMGDGALLYNRFVVLMADETHVGVSGCSVDSSVHFVRHLGQEFKTDFFDRWHVAYKKNEEVYSCSRAEFEKLVDTGAVNDDTIVFNNLVNTKADFETKWLQAYKNSWLKNLSAAHTSFNSIL